ncbi:YfhO family protein [Candidatus Enterococcus mansonii]|nr:YfhO family protein [Enterococcus sp. 4G2_DIV0659]
MNMKAWVKKIQQLPTIYLYFLFFIVSYISIYFTYIHGGKLTVGDDIYFHLNRIEALYKAILEGDYFPKITYFFANGMGYASSIFYSDVFLYPAALFRLMGFSVAVSYMYYMLLVTFFTFVIAYHSFYSVSQSKQKSLIFAFLYGLSSYRLADIVARAALGEVLAFMVLPVVFVGLIQIVRGNEKKFYILSIGMASLFFAHVLSTFIFCLFIIGYLVLNIPILIKEKKRLLYLMYATLLTILLVAVNLFPTIEQTMFQELRVQSSQIFFLQRTAANLGEYIKGAFLNQGFNNLGWFIFLAILFLLLRIKKLSIQNRQFLILGILFLYLATTHFPHYLFHDTLFNSIQFPWRYFIIVTICITWVCADSFSDVLPQKNYFSIIVITCSILLLLVSVIQYQLTERQSYKSGYGSFSRTNGFVLGAGMEYLPNSMDYEKTVLEITGVFPQEKSVEIKNTTRDNDVITFDYKAKVPTKVTLPIIYYKGYDVQVTGSGEVSEVKESKEIRGLCEVTVTGEGKLRFWYKGTVVQKVSFAISLLAWLILVGYVIRKNKREKDLII